MYISKIKDSLKNIDGILNIFLFTFIISMFNREFIPFGIDLRYIQIILSFILIVKALFTLENNKLKFKKISKLQNKYLFIVIFYIYIILVNLKWFTNGLELNRSDFINMIVLSMTNFMAIGTFYIYRDKIKIMTIVRYIIISTILLLISMILVWGDIELSKIMGGDYLGYYPGADNFNFLGQQIRVAGYAQDPNYASIFMVIGGVTSFFFVENKRDKYIIISLTIFGYILSASKTIALGLIFAIFFIGVLYLIKNKSEKIYKILLNVFVLGLAVGPYIIVKLMNMLKYSFSFDTMSTRLVMWNNAVNLFEKNPIFGGGITSVRSLFEMQPNGWYVHAHSTIFQIQSEMGIIGLIIFAAIFIMILRDSSYYIKFITIVFLIFSLTSELLHLSLFAFIIGLAPIVMNNYSVEKKEV